MGKFTAFKLPLKSLPQGEHTFTYHLDQEFFDNMESTDVRGADLNVELKVTYNGDIYNLDFHITGEVTLICDRCLDELPWPIEEDYSIAVKYGDEYRDDSDTLMEIPYSDNDLNVAYMIYDTVSLAIPIKHVHPMGKCNRAMTNVLRKHRANPADPDSELMDEMTEGIDDVEPDGDNDAPADPRWNALRGLGSDGENDAE